MLKFPVVHLLANQLSRWVAVVFSDALLSLSRLTKVSDLSENCPPPPKCFTDNDARRDKFIPTLKQLVSRRRLLRYVTGFIGIRFTSVDVVGS